MDISGNTSTGNSVSTTVVFPVFKQQGKGLIAVGQFKVTQKGSHWTSSHLGKTSAGKPQLSGELRIIKLDVPLPDGNTDVMTIALSDAGVLQISVPITMMQVYDENYLLLLALAAVVEQLDVSIEDITGTIIQVKD